MLQKKALWHGLTLLFAFLLVLSITVAVVLEQFSTTIDSALGTRSSIMVTDENDEYVYTAYTPDEAYVLRDEDGNYAGGNSHAIMQAAMDLGRQEGAEGTVLLKNENKVLPLSSGAKVTLLGLRSHVPLLGAGIGVKVQGPLIDLEAALSLNSTKSIWSESYPTMDEFTFEGAGYTLNPTTIDFYENYNATAKRTNNDSVTNEIREPGESDYTDAVISSFSSYNDAAIVVVGRTGSEASDYLPGDVPSGQGNSEPLELTTNEKYAINLAKQHFNKVIVLINSCNAMEIDDLKNDEQIDAILNISFPGAYGMLGVADILSGKTSPSGGLADIDAAKAMSAPAMMNMGDYTFSNASSIERSTKSSNYVIEAEGIYTGYRYYETRYYDSVANPSSNASSTAGVYNSTGNWNYSEEVSYGFGYGLSYTTFTQEITKTEIEQSSHEILIDFTVDVKNTGDTAGKSIVQIYGQSPYTKGGVEKSAIQLLGFGKTDTIKAGESDTVTVTVDIQNLASYDSTWDNEDGTYGNYILDKGDYYFALGNGAHDALNNVMAAQGYAVADGMDYAGDDNLVYVWQFAPEQGGDVDSITFHTTRNNTAVSNQIPYADFNYYQDGYVTYLSRSDWQGTYPIEYKNVTAPASMMDDLNGYYYTVKATDDTSDFLWGKDYGSDNIKFYEMIGADWDDYRWDQILSQLTVNEAMYLTAFAGPIFPGADSIGTEELYLADNNGNGIVYTFAGSLDQESPWHVDADDNNAAWNGQVFGASPLLAATFNPDLFLARGEFVGNESLFLGIPIIWGPGLNTHRQAYTGRNCEYYSEDPILSGIIAMEFSYGCAEYGLIAAPKHFAFNDQETNRNGVAPFMTEQRAREVELRAYQIPIEAPKYEGFGMYGLMTSFSKIGAVECTCSRGLLTGILREEWGFHGYASTDIYDDTDLYSCCVYAGITGYDLRGQQGFDSDSALSNISFFASGSQVDGKSLNNQTYTGDAAMMQALKDNSKNLLWAEVNSNLMNRYSASTHMVWQMTYWRGIYIAAITITAVLTLAGIVLFTLSYVNKKKEGE